MILWTSYLTILLTITCMRSSSYRLQVTVPIWPHFHRSSLSASQTAVNQQSSSSSTTITSPPTTTITDVGSNPNQAPMEEIIRRRNFAIISHPDAGKTTLTEKLLLFGGAIQDAGAVKARADQRKATSDWMEIEKQRGISVTSTVLSFQYELSQRKYHLNLLDTPGHQDFSEDTYRTLAAADNCVLLLDAAKGIEDRTRKLFEVCQMRNLPIFTFANKLDRPSLTPIDIIDQIEKEFGLEVCPMNWPIGDGEEFQGVYDRMKKQIHLFQRGDRRKKIFATIVELEDPELIDIIGERHYEKLLEDIEVLDTVFPQPDTDRIDAGIQTPLFFGSAMTNFGVELFLKTFLSYARYPMGREASILGTDGVPSLSSSIPNDDRSASTSPRLLPTKIIQPNHEEFSGFVFKLQANLDPKHRDRMAFIRICSGVFRKGMKVNHSRMKKTINLSSAQSLFAQDRESILEAYPGDVIGIHNPGHFAIGDTIYTGNQRITYPGIPSFSPERFAYIRNANPSFYKKFQKGVSELLNEGAVQMLREKDDDGAGIPILAAVGQLQFEVVEYRLKSEYSVESKLEPLNYILARWVNGGWEAVEKADRDGKLFGIYIVKDRWGRPVLLFRNPWKINQLVEETPELQLVPWAMPPTEFM